MKRAILLLLLIITTSITALAQRFPVAVNVQVNQPSPIYFANYADGSTINSPLRLQLVLSDLSIVNRQIGLRVFFEGNGIQFQSTDVVVGAAPLFIDGGIPLNLTNVELAPYFEFQNIQGINPNTYGAAIREGSYQICFEVYDVATQNRLSSKSCATTYIFQNEPPILTLPTKNYTIDANQVQNFVFQWTPRHINVSNVQYELSMVEIWDERVDTQTAFLSSPPVFVTTTTNTSFRYGPGQPQLLPNKRYAWRIQAKALQGAEEIGLFKNNGYSEIYWFNYTAPCLAPNNVSAEVKGIYKANIYWDETFDTTMAYEVRYREANNPNAQWFTTRSSEAWATLWDLKPSTTYEYQVTTVCELDKSPYTNQNTFTTDTVEDQESYYNCGISPDITLANKEPLEQLYVDEVFTAGDFPVKVTEINGSNGRFSGKGYVTVPYLENFRISVKFTNAFINTEKQLAEGMVVTTYDPSMKGIVDADEVIKDIVDITEDVGDAIKGGDDHEHTVDFEIEEIVVKDGQIIVKGTNGEEATFDHDEEDTYEITGTDKVYSVNKDNKITEIGDTAPGGEATASNTNGISESPMPNGNGSVVSEVATDAIVITFRNGTTDESKYGLDHADNAYERQTYPKTKDAKGNDYYPIHKAVVNNTTEVLYADIEIKNSEIVIDSLIFKTVSGLALDAKRVDGKNSYKISLKGKNGYREQEAIVTYKDASGKQNVAVNFYIHHLGKRAPIKVKVVRINNAKPIADIGQKINAIYGVAGVDFAVEAISEPFSIPEDAWDTDVDNGKIDYDGSGLLANYPKELREIHNYYKKNTSNFDDEAYYLFIIDKATEVTKPLGGFMPKTRQYGYLFERYYESDGLENKDTPAQIAAHELGHGIFSLEHPFPEGSTGADTDWLMDYNGGTELPYPHWAGINDVGVKLHFFQDDEGAEYENKALVQKILLELRCAHVSGIDKQKISYLSRLPELTNIDLNNITNQSAAIENTLYLELINDNLTEILISKNITKERGNFEKGSFTTGTFQFSYKYVYDNLTIYSNQDNIDTYLKPTIQDVQKSFQQVWSLINLSNGIDKNEFELLKSIAACDAGLISAKDRFDVIKEVYKFSTSLREPSEDLILDLMKTCPLQDVTQFLGYLNSDFELFNNLYGGMDEANWFAPENNNTRFLITLYSLWKSSDFADPTNPIYSYKNAPRILSYDHKGKLYRGFSFREVDFKLDKTTKQIRVIKTDPGNLDDQEELIYDYSYNIFQPINLLIVDEVAKGKFGEDETPVFFYMGLENLEELKARRAAIGLTVDVALLFTGVGNIAHIKNLSGGYRLFKSVIAGVEISSSVLDMVVSYSSACNGSEVFCQKIKAYNFWLQMATLSADVLVTKMVQRSAKEALEAADNSVNQKLKVHLEEVVGINNAGGELIPDVLKSARARVRSAYGDEYVDIFLKQKFGDEQGAAAVIVDKFGDAGKRILDDANIKTLSDAAKAIVKDKSIMRFYDQHMYRAVNETSYNFDKLKSTGVIDASPSAYPTYISLDNFTDAAKAKDVLQLPKKPTWVAEFTPDQVVNDIRFAKGKFNQGDYTEVLTQAYPDWGKGGGTQFLTNAEIKVSKLKNLETGEIIDFTAIRKTLADLKANTEFNKHLFKGEIKKIVPDGATQPRFSVSGVHHNSAVDNIKVKVTNKSTPDANGVYTGKVSMYHDDLQPINGTGWKKKGSNSTFFPDDWDQDKILMEISHAFENKISIGINKFEGTASNGMKIEMYIKNGVIDTAYPKIN